MDEIKAVRGNLKTFGSKRVNMLLGFGTRRDDVTDEEIALARQSRYGIGTKRTLEQAEEFTGINFKERKMDVNKCGNLKWVPYEESPDYGVGETLSRGHAGETIRPFVVKPDHMSKIQQDILFLESEATDYNFIGGLALATLAIVLRLLTRKKEKAESHKV